MFITVTIVQNSALISCFICKCESKGDRIHRHASFKFLSVKHWKPHVHFISLHIYVLHCNGLSPEKTHTHLGLTWINVKKKNFFLKRSLSNYLLIPPHVWTFCLLPICACLHPHRCTSIPASIAQLSCWSPCWCSPSAWLRASLAWLR